MNGMWIYEYMKQYMNIQYILSIPNCSGTGWNVRIRQSSDYREFYVQIKGLKGDTYWPILMTWEA